MGIIVQMFNFTILVHELFFIKVTKNLGYFREFFAIRNQCHTIGAFI